MKKLSLVWAAVILLSLFNTSANAQIVDWSGVTLSGTFPNFTFSDSTLGNVTLSYSTDNEFSGIGTILAVPTLMLGNTGGESLTMSWSNPVTKLNMEIWDIDAIPGFNGEFLTFTTSATTTIDTLHATDVWNPATLTLSSDGTPNPNNSLDNFTVMNFTSSSGFNSIQFNWDVDGAGVPGIGKISIPHAPEPISSTLFIVGAATLGFRHFRRKSIKK